MPTVSFTPALRRFLDAPTVRVAGATAGEALLHDSDPAKSARVMQVTLQMGKLDIAALQRAHQQE